MPINVSVSNSFLTDIYLKAKSIVLWRPSLMRGYSVHAPPNTLISSVLLYSRSLTHAYFRITSESVTNPTTTGLASPTTQELAHLPNNATGSTSSPTQTPTSPST